jgi:hypothetical protein
MTYSRRQFNKMALLAAGATAAGGTGLASGAGRSGGDQCRYICGAIDHADRRLFVTGCGVAGLIPMQREE